MHFGDRAGSAGRGTLSPDRLGICVKCDAGLCRSYFHVTCAQKFGLLSENESNQNCDSDPYFVYCPLHMEKKKMGESQKLFLTAQATVKTMKDKFRCHSPRQNESLTNALQAEQRLYVNSQRVRFPSMPVAGAPQSRLLSSSPALLRALNKKAELSLGIDVRSPAVHFPQPSEIRKRHRVTPALSVEFASHYVDRELRVAEARERIERLTEENEKMLQTQSNLEQKYEDLQNMLHISQTQEERLVQESRQLFTMFLRLKMWLGDNKDSLQKSKFTAMKPLIESANVSTEQRFPTKRRHSNDDEEIRLKTIRTSGSTSEFPLNKRKCSECKSDKNQHLMIDCDACKRWLHIGCLDPPLTNMPRKSKYSVWHCSECALSSGSDSDVEEVARGLLITSEGRRQTQRRHKPPEKLMSTMLYNQHQARKRKDGQIRRLIEKGQIVKKRPQPGAAKGNKRFKVRGELGKYQSRTANKQLLAKPRVIVNRNLNFGLQNSSSPKPEQKNELESTKNRKILPASLSIGREKSILPRTQSVSTPNLLPSKDRLFVPRYILIPTQRDLNTKPFVIPQESTLEAVQTRVEEANPSEKHVSNAREQPLTNKIFAKISQNNQECDKPKPNATEARKEKSPHPVVKAPSPPPSCSVCHLDSAGHKMVCCQICKKYYHIWCCDPPLKNKPRTSRYFWWECSDCQHSSAESESLDTSAGSETTPDGRRKITRARKPPEKFDNIIYSFSSRRLMKTVLNRRKNALNGGNLVKKRPRRTSHDQRTEKPKSKPAIITNVAYPTKASLDNKKSETFPKSQNKSEPNDEAPAQNSAFKNVIISKDAASDAVSSLTSLTNAGNSDGDDAILKTSNDVFNNVPKASEPIPRIAETSRTPTDFTATNDASPQAPAINASSDYSPSKNMITINLPKPTSIKTAQISPTKIQPTAPRATDNCNNTEDDVLDTVGDVLETVRFLSFLQDLRD